MSVRKIVYRIAGCWMLAVTAAAAVPVQGDESAPPEQGGLLCTDNMVTDPETSDLDAIPVSAQVDGGCMVPEGPIGI